MSTFFHLFVNDLSSAMMVRMWRPFSVRRTRTARRST